jgi:aerobic carbon-monoxide dehydrogenase large subunit
MRAVDAASAPVGREGGTVPTLPVVINAIVDALSEFGGRHIEMPATPERVWQAIQEARRNDKFFASISPLIPA